MAGIRVVALRDIATFFGDFYGVGFRTISTFLETLIFAYILSKAVPSSAVLGLSYLQFFALGAIVTSTFWAAYDIGQDVHWDRESGFLHYLMSLPIGRGEIIIGRSLGGATRALFNAIPLYGLAAILVPTTVLNIIGSLGLLFILSIGLCGLGILISLSVLEEMRVRLLSTLLSLVLIRSSTAIYPSVAMPVWLQVGTKFNPITHASDATRDILAGGMSPVVPIDAISFLVLFTLLAGMLGSWLFSKKIEGGPAE